MNENFLVSRDYLSKYWIVSAQRHGVSANVWETDLSLGFFRTATAARYALEAREGGKLTAWTRSHGRGSANYRAQNYTGPIKSGPELGPIKGA